MIDLDSTPARYRGTIEVYETEVDDFNEATWRQTRVIEWRWRCKSRNGQILGHGEAGALSAIDAMFGAKFWAAYDGDPAKHVVPWRLVIVDRHGVKSNGAVY